MPFLAAFGAVVVGATVGVTMGTAVPETAAVPVGVAEPSVDVAAGAVGVGTGGFLGSISGGGADLQPASGHGTDDKDDQRGSHRTALRFWDPPPV